MPGAHKIGAAISASRIAGGKMTDMRLFLRIGRDGIPESFGSLGRFHCRKQKVKERKDRTRKVQFRFCFPLERRVAALPVRVSTAPKW